jgi:hypothetical protein
MWDINDTRIIWTKNNWNEFSHWVADFLVKSNEFINDFRFKLSETIDWIDNWIKTYKFILWDEVIITSDYKINPSFLNVLSIETSNSPYNTLRKTTKKIKIKNAWRFIISKLIKLAKNHNLKTIIFSSIHEPSMQFYNKIIIELLNEWIIENFEFNDEITGKQHLKIELTK